MQTIEKTIKKPIESLEWVLGPSKGLLSLFIVCYALSLIIFLVIDIPIILKIIGSAWLIYDLKIKSHKYALRKEKSSIIHLWQNTKGQWGCATNEGKRSLGFLKSDSYQSQFLIILHIQTNFYSKSVIIPRDSINDREYRMLKVRVSV